MDSAGWDHQDHQGLQPSAEDDFQQFLNIGNIGSLADGLHFEFQDFPNAGHGTLMSQGSREQLDTPMGGTEAAVVLGSSNGLMSSQMTPMSAPGSRQSIPAQMIPAPLPTPADAIVAIDAQIQFLQQAKLQQQQQQLQEQSAFFANQSRNVPPTPQSMELPPNGHQFYSPEQVAQQQPSVFENGYQRIREQQDVRPLCLPGCRLKVG